MKKGDILENILVENMAAEGKCVSRIEGRVIFIEGAVPGDIADVALTRIKTSFLEGRAIAIKKLSDKRVEPFCEHVGLCGGCKWQNLNYAEQLQYKQQQVIDNLERLGGLTLPPLFPIVASQQTRHYRNKLEYSFTAKRWLTSEEMNLPSPSLSDTPLPGERESIKREPGLGYHLPKSFDKVFDVKNCYLQPEPSNSIRLAIRELALKEGIPFFDLRSQQGFLRTLCIRTAAPDQAMVILQVTSNKKDWLDLILGMIAEKFPQVNSINYVVNSKKNDSFADLDVICWKGAPYIIEQMPKADGSGVLQFQVGPKSFYQTNAQQACELYKIALNMADLNGGELVYDLYTGTGTIANFVASRAKKVIGLEYVAPAIEDAKVNSRLNNITNTEFFAGDIKDLLDDTFLKTHGRPDVIITDPPRAGMHEDVCKMLLRAAPEKIVYVSCNVATQARDLKILSEKYTITAVQPVDMFPHTMHVENVVALKKIGA
jgi:23S rRNA (uracil1939-C5)-methyltransferase